MKIKYLLRILELGMVRTPRHSHNYCSKVSKRSIVDGMMWSKQHGDGPWAMFYLNSKVFDR